MRKMKSTFTLVLIFVLSSTLFTACDKYRVPKDTPECIKNKIVEFDAIACDDGKVDKYTYQGKTVYVFAPGIECGADLTSEVVLEDCTNLGYLGGIAGNTIINGENFSSAVFVKNIWRK